MEKYFERNTYKGRSLIYLHDDLTRASGTVASNLFFHEASDRADTENHRTILAKSAYRLIGVCEAIIDRVPEAERKKAYEEMREDMAPVSFKEAIERLYDLIAD